MSGWTGRTLSAVLIAGVVALAGCGGSSSSSSTSSAASSGNTGTSSSSSSTGSAASSGNTGSSSTGGAASSGNTGSSSSGGGSTLNTDVQAVNKAVQGYTASTSAVGTAATDPASWDQLSQGAKKAAGTITGLTAPASLQSEQQALATTLNQISDTATKVATDLRNNDATAAQADLAAAKAASQAYQAAGAAWTAAAKSAAGS